MRCRNHLDATFSGMQVVDFRLKAMSHSPAQYLEVFFFIWNQPDPKLALVHDVCILSILLFLKNLNLGN